MEEDNHSEEQLFFSRKELLKSTLARDGDAFTLQKMLSRIYSKY